MSRRATRYPVYGEWLTIREVAERLGITYAAVRQYRRRNPDRDGRPPSMEAVCKHYRAVQAGEIPYTPGRPPKRHRVNSRLMTVDEAARALGVDRRVLDCHISRHRCGVAEAYEAIDARKTRRAELEIMKILKGK